MLKYVTFQEAVGKTIKSVYFAWDKMLVMFTDSTFATAIAKLDYDNEAELVEHAFDFFEWQSYDLVGLGVVTAEEANALRRHRDDEWKKVVEREERKKLIELQAKYGQSSL